jgi:hypothetical protein
LNEDGRMLDKTRILENDDRSWKLDRRFAEYEGGKIFLQKVGVIIETKQCENVFV